jgi:hypothetical protein
MSAFSLMTCSRRLNTYPASYSSKMFFRTRSRHHHYGSNPCYLLIYNTLMPMHNFWTAKNERDCDIYSSEAKVMPICRLLSTCWSRTAEDSRGRTKVARNGKYRSDETLVRPIHMYM